MNHQVSTEIRHDDEIDLMELLQILIKEKKTIFVTMLIVTLLSLGGALYERNISKKASIIVTTGDKFKEENLLVSNVLSKIYFENSLNKENISLDEFREKFKITGIIPKEVKEKKDFLAKSGETLKYGPDKFRIDLRVGSIGQSEKILKEYYIALNEYYKAQNESRYKFKYFDSSILDNDKYNYEDYLRILNERKQSLKELISGREDTRLEYATYGFGYRRIQIALTNLENIRIRDLKNYLLATNIVKNSEKFKSEFINRKVVLENKIREKKGEGENYKRILKEQKNEGEGVIIPKGTKINVGDNQKERYYTEIMNSYLKSENDLVALQQELNELVSINKNLRVGTEAEKEYIIDSLRDIVKSYNNIVTEVNILEAKENYINNGELIKQLSPIEVVSKSKAKIILGAGMVMGLFLGVMMAFIKNFYHSFKKFSKALTVVVLFSLVGINSYSKEEVILQFTHKEIKEGLNPDKTPFDLDNILLKEFLVNKLGVEVDSLEKVSIKPLFPKNSLENVQNRLIETGEIYRYVPTEYLVILNLKDNKEEKRIKESLIKEFPTFYINHFLQQSIAKYDYLEDYDSYRDILKAFNNLIAGLETEISLRKSEAKKKEVYYEYNNLGVELSKIKNINYRDVANYIKSNNLVTNESLEKLILSGELLSGENKYLLLELESLKKKEKIYGNILKEYPIGEKQISILENGDISVNEGTNLKEKQYIEISKTYLNSLNEKNSLQVKIDENQRLLKEMKGTTEKQKNFIDERLSEVQDDINELMIRMVEIELRDYKREYVDSVKVF